MEWVRDFLDFVHARQLFAPEEKILLAVSGGKDSMFMSYLFAQSDFKFGMAHCNFGLRGTESDGDERLVKSWAESLGTPFHANKFDTQKYADERHVSIQMAARQLRYGWFGKLMAQHGYNKLAIAHHRNDSVETVLLNLCRGTGLTGMHGILPRRGHIVRPLLYLSRQDIDRAIQDLRLPYREDASNLSDKYARNRIRLHVVPELKKINPSLEETFERNMARFQEMEELLESIKEQTKERLLGQSEGGFDIDIAQFTALRPLKLMSYMVLSDFGFSEATIGDLLASLSQGVRSGKRFHSSRFDLLIDRGKLMLREKGKESQTERTNFGLGEWAVWKNSKLGLSVSTNAYTCNTENEISVDADKLVLPLQVRTWQQGDYFQPFGMRGRKKISDFFISIKLSLLEKREVPIVVNGNGDIIWVAPFRMDNRFRVSAKTKKIYNLAFEKYEQ